MSNSNKLSKIQKVFTFYLDFYMTDMLLIKHDSQSVTYLMNRKMRDELCWIRRSHSIGYLHAAGQSLPWLICIHPPLSTLREKVTST